MGYTLKELYRADFDKEQTPPVSVPLWLGHTRMLLTECVVSELLNGSLRCFTSEVDSIKRQKSIGSSRLSCWVSWLCAISVCLSFV